MFTTNGTRINDDEEPPVGVLSDSKNYGAI